MEKWLSKNSRTIREMGECINYDYLAELQTSGLLLLGWKFQKERILHFRIESYFPPFSDFLGFHALMETL